MVGMMASEGTDEFDGRGTTLRGPYISARGVLVPGVPAESATANNLETPKTTITTFLESAASVVKQSLTVGDDPAFFGEGSDTFVRHSVIKSQTSTAVSSPALFSSLYEFVKQKSGNGGSVVDGYVGCDSLSREMYTAAYHPLVQPSNSMPTRQQQRISQISDVGQHREASYISIPIENSSSVNNLTQESQNQIASNLSTVNRRRRHRQQKMRHALQRANTTHLAREGSGVELPAITRRGTAAAITKTHNSELVFQRATTPPGPLAVDGSTQDADTKDSALFLCEHPLNDSLAEDAEQLDSSSVAEGRDSMAKGNANRRDSAAATLHLRRPITPAAPYGMLYGSPNNSTTDPLRRPVHWRSEAIHSTAGWQSSFNRAEAEKISKRDCKLKFGQTECFYGPVGNLEGDLTPVNSMEIPSLLLDGKAAAKSASVIKTYDLESKQSLLADLTPRRSPDTDALLSSSQFPSADERAAGATLGRCVEEPIHTMPEFGSGGLQMNSAHDALLRMQKSVVDDDLDDEDEEAEDPAGLLGILAGQPVFTLMLALIPIGFFAYYKDWGDCPVFLLNFLAIVPMAWLMGKATEDLSVHMGQITGGLLNAWFGNVVEMLLCVAGLRRGELVIVRSTLIGSILSNLLLVTGCSFLLGGMKHKVQEFSAIGASTNASLMTLSCMCLGLPTIYATILSQSTASQSELAISRTVSFFLIFVYFQYLLFQLGTHSFLFSDDDEETADLSVWASTLVLVCCSITCSFSSDFLVSSIQGVVTKFNLSQEFIGIILLPIVGNAAEHYTSVIVAMRDKMDLSLACAVGSSCQMALFVTPFTVLVGWAMDQPMSLNLHAFELLVLVMSVLIITSILQDGYSHWLEGSMLVSAYCVIAIIYFFEDASYSTII